MGQERSTQERAARHFDAELSPQSRDGANFRLQFGRPALHQVPHIPHSRVGSTGECGQRPCHDILEGVAPLAWAT